MQADIQRLMDGELGQWLTQQEEMRNKARKKAFNRWFYGAIALLPVLGFMWFVPIAFTEFKLIISGIGVVGVAAWGYFPIADAVSQIKVGINSAIAREFGISYDEEALPGEEFHAAKEYGLLPRYDRSNFEDRWYGDLEGHAFKLYESHLEERRGSGKNKRWVTVFRGAIINVGFGREFNSTTLLQRKGKHKKWLGLGGRKDEVNFDGHQLRYVNQVHPDFEDVFDVYSDDQIEARVLIHPSYIEHLLALEKAFHGDEVRALFSHGEVVLVVESGDLFESGTMKASEDRARVAEAAEQFGALAGLALAINQNERGRVLRES